MSKIIKYTTADQIIRDIEHLGVKYEENNKTLRNIREISAIFETKNQNKEITKREGQLVR